ncbi:glycosyltransferase family 2 protein [Flavobacterium praedii]|uniref:glycosyltransferase family 2 protein n=1 Tax=Flavobacterium praedii TaxID=3002900 RepID=UPI002481C2D0|nr:glycosyltransferase [Flavobacterium praedii]
MIKKSPLVSICIPTYNGSKFILAAIESAIQQSYNNIEIIISDDNSKDATLEIIKLRLGKASIPYFIFHHIPQGIGENWNNCVRNSNGEFIKFLFQDDVLEKDCIRKMIELSLLDNRIGLVYCKRNIIFDSDNIDHKNWIVINKNLHQNWSNLKIKEGFIEGNLYLKDLNLMREPLNKIGEPTAVLLKKECFEKVGYFSKNLKQTLDFEFWYRVMKYYKIGFLDEELVWFRLHPEQATFKNKFSYNDEIAILNKTLYSKLFWRLHLNRQWKLFKSQSKLGDFYRFIKNKIKR